MVHQCTDTYGNRAWLQAGIVSHITVLSSEHQHLCPLWALSTRSQAHTLEKTGTQCWWKSPLICFWSLGQSIPAKPDQLHCKYKKKLQRPETKVQKNGNWFSSNVNLSVIPDVIRTSATPLLPGQELLKARAVLEAGLLPSSSLGNWEALRKLHQQVSTVWKRAAVFPNKESH